MSIDNIPSLRECELCLLLVLCLEGSLHGGGYRFGVCCYTSSLKSSVLVFSVAYAWYRTTLFNTLFTDLYDPMLISCVIGNQTWLFFQTNQLFM